MVSVIDHFCVNSLRSLSHTCERDHILMHIHMWMRWVSCDCDRNASEWVIYFIRLSALWLSVAVSFVSFVSLTVLVVVALDAQYTWTIVVNICTCFMNKFTWNKRTFELNMCIAYSACWSLPRFVCLRKFCRWFVRFASNYYQRLWSFDVLFVYQG